MSVIKDGQEVTEVIIQEGVPTTSASMMPSPNPVVYMLDATSSAASTACTPSAASTRTSMPPLGLRAAGFWPRARNCRTWCPPGASAAEPL